MPRARPETTTMPASPERGGEVAREPAAIGRGVARADHRDDRAPQQFGPPEHGQDRRRVLDRRERRSDRPARPSRRAAPPSRCSAASSASASVRVTGVTVLERSPRRASCGTISSAARAEPKRRSSA